MFRASRRFHGLVALGLAVALAGCGGIPSPGGTPSATTPSPGGTPSATTPSAAASRTGTGTAGSAADALAGFFAAATAMDAGLRDAAARLNAGVRVEAIRITPAAVAAVKAVEPWSLVATLPGGLDEASLAAALQVFADLSARRFAFKPVVEDASLGTVPRPGEEATRILDCLANGGAPAAAFVADLAAARAIAARAPAPAPLDRSSRAVAEVAIWAHTLYLPNACAEECGAYLPRPVTLPRIVWKPATLAPGSTWDGTVGGAYFTAHYQSDHTWSVGTNAC